ncbi:hypothetical protein L4C33_16520 [Vibrio makurazakiensis]|uniref:hypothetical protein n=1 Tax=Vibrio makurazakiensis TaxID=2910250 RepID=UPI003D0F878E
MSIQYLQKCADEVNAFNEHVTLIQSLHTQATEQVDWEAVANIAPPVMPMITFEHKSKAIETLSGYQFSWMNYLTQKRPQLDALLQDIETSTNKDIAHYQTQLKCWQQEYSEWLQKTKLAKNVLNNDNDSKIEALRQQLESWTQQAPGFPSISSNDLEYKNGYCLDVNIRVDQNIAVPRTQKSLFQGLLKVETIPFERRNKIYQEYVYSSAMKAALDIFATLPDNHVKVNVQDKDSDNNCRVIFSIHIERKLLNSLDLNNDSASELISNFIHFQKFDGTQEDGFTPINHPFEPSANFLSFLV